ncbi:MAG: hypothetical protein F4X11_07870 [Acidobacteria bacterium]|nr:hypothetical protein [Acidobacteriota bacterium]
MHDLEKRLWKEAADMQRIGIAALVIGGGALLLGCFVFVTTPPITERQVLSIVWAGVGAGCFGIGVAAYNAGNAILHWIEKDQKE